MISVWDAKDANTIRIVSADNQIIEGEVVEILDVDEESDLGFGEDSITVKRDGSYIGIPQSEILSLEILS